MAEGDKHRSLVDLVHAFPAVVGVLLEDVMGEKPPPGYRQVKPGPEELSVLKSQKLTADNVLLFEDSKGKSLLGVIFEIQQQPDDEKLFRWPLYYYQLRDLLNPTHDPEHECPVKLLVFVVDERTARWAGKVFTGRGGKISFAPDVLGPQNLPEITDLETARNHPALATLCAAAHPQSLAAARAAVAAVEALPEHGRDILFTVLVNHVQNVEALKQMSAAFDEFTGDFARHVLEEGLRQKFLGIALEQLRTRFPELGEDVIKAVNEAPTEELEKVITKGEILLAKDLSTALGHLHASSAPDEAADRRAKDGDDPADQEKS
jgi:hypothetical protein